MADKQKETKEKKRGSFASWFIEDEDEELLPEDVIVVFIEKDLEKGLDYRRITVRSRRNLDRQ